MIAEPGIVVARQRIGAGPVHRRTADNGIGAASRDIFPGSMADRRVRTAGLIVERSVTDSDVVVAGAGVERLLADGGVVRARCVGCERFIADGGVDDAGGVFGERLITDGGV